MTKRITLEWAHRARLRLRLPGGAPRALRDARGAIPPEAYVLDEAAGEIALMADPVGEVTAEVDAAPEFPAHEADEA